MRKLWIAVVPVTLVAAAFVLASPKLASATTQKRVKPAPVTCGAISDHDDPAARTFTVSGCTGPTGGAGTVASPFFTPSTIEWAAGGSTTVTFNGRVHEGRACPNGETSALLRGGKVTSSTVAGISGRFAVTFCFDASGNISLKPGTLMRF